MADGKQQQQQSADALKASQTQNSKRESLLAKAKERIDKVDVAEDDKHDEQEKAVKKKALEFVSNECLNLPEDRFFKLIDAIELRMRQKEAYKQNLLEEFRKVRKEIADSVAQTSAPIRENSAVTQNDYTPKSLTKDMGEGLYSYATTAITNNFRPEKYSDYDLPMLEAMEKYPQSSKQFYEMILKRNESVVGFLMHWGPEHPAFKALQAKGMARAISMITKVEARLRTEFGVPRNSEILNGDPKETAKILLKRVTAWKTGDKFDATANKALDVLNLDRKLFKHRFESHPKSMGEEEYSTYVQRSANYLEYAASKNGAGMKDFFEQLEENPETVAGFVTNWNVNNQIYQALSVRGKADSVGLWVHRVKNEVMRKYGIATGTDTVANHEKNLNFIRAEMGRSKADKAYDMAWTAKEAFSGNSANDIKAARYLNAATAKGNEKSWDTFVSSLKADPKKFAQFIYSWNENSSLWKEIARNNGAEAIQRLNELKKRAHLDYSIPLKFSGMSKDHALGAIEKWLDTNADLWKQREELTEKIKEKYPEFRKYVEAAFAEMREGVLENKPKMVDKARDRLVKFSNESLLPLHIDAQKLLGYYSNEKGERFYHPQHQQIASLRVAIEAMNVIKLSDTGNEWYSDIKKVVMSDANKTWVDAKKQQVSRILDNGDLWAVVGFSSEFAWAVRTQKPFTGAEFATEIRTKDIQNVDSEAFYQATCQMHVLGQLNARDLKAQWGEFKLLKIALHWGIVKWGKEEESFNNSGAYKKLKRDRPQVAEVFKQALKDVVLEREDDLRRMDAENADLKALSSALKTIKPGISEKEIETVLAGMKGKEGSDRYRALERLKGGELSVNEIEAFFSALSKVEYRQAEKNAKSMMSYESREDEVKNVGELSVLKKAAEASYAKTKSPEDKAIIDLLSSSKFETIDKSEDPKGRTPRPRKMKEVSSEDLQKLVRGAKYLPENSKLRKYLESFLKAKEGVARSEENGAIAGNAKKVKPLMDRVAKLPEAERKDVEQKFSKAVRTAGEISGEIAASSLTWVRWAPLTQSQAIIIKGKAQDIKKLESELNMSIDMSKSGPMWKALGNIEYGMSGPMSYARLAEDISEGRIPMDAITRAHFQDVLKEKRSQVEAIREEGVRGWHGVRWIRDESAISEKFTASDFFSESKPGERLRIWEDMTAVKTESGGLEVITSYGKLRFSSYEAEGAVQQIELLKEAGAEFLIPAMNEIAAASQTRIKDGVGRAESGRILSVLSRAFGFDSVANETDPKLMLEKFKTAAVWGLWGGDIWAKARSLGILDPKNNSLKHEVLVERMKRWTAQRP